MFAQDEMATLRQQTENLAASNADLTEQINLLKKQLAILCADQPLAEEVCLRVDVTAASLLHHFLFFMLNSQCPAVVIYSFFQSVFPF